MHRDIKPGNTLLRPDNSISFIDWDLAVTREELKAQLKLHPKQKELCVGTCDFMAPEQTRGNSFVSPKSDDFALGLTSLNCATPIIDTFRGGQRDVMIDRSNGTYWEGLRAAFQRLQSILDQMITSTRISADQRIEFEEARATYQRLQRWYDCVLAHSEHARPNTTQEHLQLLNDNGNLDTV